MDNLRDFDLVITDNKQEILSFLNDNKLLISLKIMSYKEFINNFFGSVDEKALYYLVKKYNYSYEVAKMYLDNFLFNKDLYKELSDNDLINIEPLFKNSFKRVVLNNVMLDPFIIDALKDYEVITIESKELSYIPELHVYNSIEEEVNYTCLSIINDLGSVNIDKIHLVNVGDDYKKHIKRLFSFYNIPIDLNEEISLYGLPIIKEFINKIDNLEEALNILDDETKKIIIDIVNKYAFTNFDETIKYLVIEEIKNKKVKSKKLGNSVTLKNISDIKNDDIYYVLNCNQGVFPKTYKDEDYLSDKEKEKLGILTSLDKNKNEKNKTLNIIKSYPHVILSYIKENNGEELYKSSLLNDLEITPNIEDNYNLSNIYNKIRLSCKLDDYIKFNIHNNDLDMLYNNYKDISYLTYDNKYTTINEDLFKKYIDNKINLSYSSLNNFYKCKFRFYLSNILKIDEFEETFHTIIGNLFHHVLECAFKPNFDFDKEFNSFLTDKEFNHKELFFINKLKEDLHFIIDVINEQDQNSSLDKAFYEKKFAVNKDHSIKVTFKGFIDKIKYSEVNGKTVLAIIDYKTGNPDINLDKVYYGIDMQLPIYIYLVKNSELINVEIAGFYLQHLLPSISNYQEGKDYLIERSKEYRLTGYSNSDTSILEVFDKNFSDSTMIKGLKITQKGDFSATSKVLSSKDMDTLTELVDKKIDEAIIDIENRNFEIDPKQIGDYSGCEHCKFKDICYKREEDIKRLKEVNYKDYLGGCENA